MTMIKIYISLLLTGLLTIILSFNSNGQQSSKNGDVNTSELSSISTEINFDELIGGYATEKNGKIEINVMKNGDNYYLQISGHKGELMEKISNDDYLRILGSNWQSNLLIGLHSGAFFIIKVKKGCFVQNITINSGFFGLIPAPVELWKKE